MIIDKYLLNDMNAVDPERSKRIQLYTSAICSQVGISNENVAGLIII